MIDKIYLMLICLYLLWNIITFFMMGIDKRKAKKGRWRLSEKTLLLSALFFGGVGSFIGMKIFRHKTKHWYFRLFLPIFALVQTALICYIIVVK